MALRQSRPSAFVKELDRFLLEPTQEAGSSSNDANSFGADLPIKEINRKAGSKKTSRWGLSFIFGLGLLVGILFIGWRIVPLAFNSPVPGQSSPEYTQMLLTWEADRYWKTANTAQAQKDLAGWNRDELAQTLYKMQHATTDVEQRKRLIALGVVLHLPMTDESLPELLFSQPGFVLGIVLSAASLLGAIGMVGLPAIRERRKAKQEEELLAQGKGIGVGENLEEQLLAEDQLEDGMTAGPGLTEAEAAAQAAEEEQKKKEEEEKKKQEEEEESSSGLGDLASLFEEEDTSITALETFCKGLPDISIDELLANSKQVVQRLRQGRAAK